MVDCDPSPTQAYLSVIWRETLAIGMNGTLYIVATPIGNLEDLSPRAARTLREVDLIACEDTRQTHKLLQHLHLEKSMTSYHDHNEREKIAGLISHLQAGKSLALVSDAGTPTLSDPGFRLVQEAVEKGIPVSPIPGPSAAITALAASGLPTDAFFFGGFFSHKRTQRVQQLEAAGDLPATLIFYETPHRILEALEDIETTLGDRHVVLGRELTKMHEEFLRGRPKELREALAGRPLVRGEFTVLIGKSTTKPIDDRPIEEAIAELQRAGVSRMDAIKSVARERGLPKREVYRLLQSTVQPSK